MSERNERVSAISLDQIIANYGIAGLFVGAGIEGETVVVLGGMMVHRGTLAFLPAIAAASAGSFVVDQLFFQLGRRFRTHSFVQKMQSRAAFAKALSAFDKHPVLFVFVFRFLYGLRTVSPLAIGTTSLPARTFLTINALAAVVWGTLFISVGYCFGTAIEAAFGRLRSAEHLVFAAIGVATIVALTVILLKRRRA
ncbi:DedA family protein [Novosphingobium sp. Rr 2-17]|uniref:DedA family protein n=1 Tax=Novosphingobium sp. Rr 2-17 TaxID=555793 RepID=UPI001ED927AD|nr:DedA family protein [Novosphingobium sp. Rr 2-17]